MENADFQLDLIHFIRFIFLELLLSDFYVVNFLHLCGHFHLSCWTAAFAICKKKYGNRNPIECPESIGSPFSN